jgi:transposase
VYLRRSDRTKDGKTHTYWRLVRSVRQGGKVVQQTVAQLGELDAEGRAKARALARAIAGGYAQANLFEEAPADDTPVAVQLNRVRLERGRSFGDVWLGWTLWCALGLDRLCAELLPAGREAVPWSGIAATLVIGRLCEPSSELYLAERWYPRTALEDLLGLPAEQMNDDRLYRALDRLLPHKETIEKHLVGRLGELFAVDYDLLLYDVTSTYFEGLAEGNVLARRGHSRDHRHDCKQVCIALVVTREGIPLGHEIFAGNRTDVTTVEEIVGTMESRYGMAQRIWVMDRGMTSAENIAWLRRTGRRYLIGTPKSELRKWSREISEARDWQQVRDGVEAKLCPGPDGAETFLLCRSVERRAKERAIHERFIQRLETALASLAQRIERSRRRLERDAIHEQIGRLRERYSRAAGRYDIRLVDEPSTTSGLRLNWSSRADWDAWTRHSEGCYVLRTNVTDWKAEDLWRTYIQLSEAEAAFRIQKSELSIRPVWHQTAPRVRAHILVCFLAYVLWKTLEQWQTRAGLGNSPRVLLDELATIHSTDVVLPLADHSGREVRIRCVVRPDRHQGTLLDRLGLHLPDRLRIPRSMAEM